MAVDDVVARGVARSTAAPWVYRVLWALGLRIRPPHFQHTLALTAINGLAVALSAAGPLTVWLVVRNGPDYLPSALHNVILTSSAVFGLVCGLALAAYYRLVARRLGQPAWELYCLLDDDAGW